VIIQDDAFEATASVTVCALTSHSGHGPLLRPLVAPNAENGLLQESALMVDKIATMPRAKLGRRIGRLGDEDMRRLGEALFVFLGLAAPPARRKRIASERE
jgi:mRNA interferase MazF